MKKFGFDGALMTALIGLSLIGSLFVHSATLSKSGHLSELDIKQLVYLAASVVLFLAVSLFFDYRALKTRSFLLWGAAVASLVWLLLFETPIKGAKAWINFSFAHKRFSLEPAEFAKLLTGVVGADFLSERSERGLGFRALFILGALVALPALLTLQQPALGMAISYFPVLAALVFIAPFSRRMLWTAGLIAFALGLGTSTFVYNNVLKDYQRTRIQILFHPELDPQGAAYHVSQSKIAIGSGGLFGKGIARGSLNRLNYVPEQHTDFIFAVICEETGLLGALIVFSLYALLFYRCVQIASAASDLFGLYLVTALAAVPLFQALVNVGMVIGLLPVTGIPLPFISYGGTSLLAFWTAFGLIHSVHRRRFGERAEATR